MKLMTAGALQLLSAIVLIATPPAIAGQWTWEELYKGGNYIDAAAELKSELNKKGKNTVANNYYLADCLLRLDKVQEALPYYMKVYKMAPQGRFGKYAQQVLKRYNMLATKNVTVGLSPAGKAKQFGIRTPGDSVPSKTENDQSEPAKAAPSAAQNDELLRNMEKKLPKFVKAPRLQPTQAELGTWSVASLAGYYPTAASRVSDAESRLDNAKRLLNEATSKISGSGSSFRKYGESNDETKARVDATNEAIDKALKPFNDNVEELTSQLNEQQAILQMCVNARNTYYSTPIGFPIYRRW